MRKLIVLATLFAAVAAPALAGQAVTLRGDIADADGRITLGELFDGAGAASNVVIATRSGPSAVLDAGAVQMAARRAGLDWANPQGLRRIIVRGGGESAAAASASAPAARGNVQVLAYARAINAGEMVQPEDLTWIKVAVAPAGAPRDPDAVIGMMARRPVREGAAVSMGDLSAPLVVKQGDLITVTYSNDGITLTMQGKAMASAAVGQPFNVLNLTSKKVVEAVASGPGQAVVGPEADQMKAARNANIASR